MKLSTDLFFWDAKDKEFRQEASSLEWRAGFYAQSITLWNPKTGGLTKFNFKEKDYHNEELSSWNYVSVGGRLKICVWND